MNILVVDDEPGIRSICERVLLAEGFFVDTAESAEAALQKLSIPWDIVLTDIMMPGVMDGIELCARVRGQSSADVLVMTAYPQMDTAIGALHHGAYDYIIKPFTPNSLLITVRRCLEKRTLSKELVTEKTLRAELEKAQKVKETFGHFVTQEVAEFVLKQPENIWKCGTRKTVTVLFADVRGFTAYANFVPAEQVVESLNQIFEILISCVQSEGGSPNKFLGDGMLAVFGAPIESPNHAKAAMRAALHAQKRLNEWMVSRRTKHLAPLHLGIGINTGEVIVGCLGTRDRTEWSVIGHEVNLAARLEAAALPGQILLGFQTAHSAEGSFQIRTLSPMHFKGFREPVPVAELLG